MPKLIIGYFYKNELNLYGDNGNIEVLIERSKRRGIDTEVHIVDKGTPLDAPFLKDINLIFMGGGPDSSQKSLYEDLLNNKSSFLKNYIEKDGVGLYVCGSYQLLGHYYKAADGTVLEGMKVFNIYTEHFGNKKPRCIGNTSARLSPVISNSPTFKNVSHLGDTISGFENHGGRTYFMGTQTPFANVIKGAGNNNEDGTEGILYKNSIGTYFHGPILARNPHLADYLICVATGLDTLDPLPDYFINNTFTAQKILKR